MIRKTVGVLILVVCTVVLSCGHALAQAGKHPMVVVAADGTGEFGPTTPGTTTSGIQEGMDYCFVHNKDLYIKGGATYNISDTIKMPPIQNGSLDGGNYVLNWVGPPDKDLMFVDSTMDFHSNFGAFVYNGTGAAIRFKPTLVVPQDKLVCMVDSEFRIAAVLSSLNSGTSWRSSGTGVVFDSTNETFYHSYLYFGAIRNFATCLTTTSSGMGFGIRVTCPDLRTNVNNGVLAYLGPASNGAIYKLGIGADSGATNVTGVQVFGHMNTLDIMTKGGFASGRDLVFEPSSSRSMVSLNPASGVDPISIVTDNAASISNQISWTGAAGAIRSLVASGSSFSYTHRLYTATVRIVGGSVSNIRLIRSGTPVNYGSSREDMLMSVGDTLQFNCSGSPVVLIIPQVNG